MEIATAYSKPRNDDIFFALSEMISYMFTWAILKIFVDISITLKVINSKIHK